MMMRNIVNLIICGMTVVVFHEGYLGLLLGHERKASFNNAYDDLTDNIENYT